MFRCSHASAGLYLVTIFLSILAVLGDGSNRPGCTLRTVVLPIDTPLLIRPASGQRFRRTSCTILWLESFQSESIPVACNTMDNQDVPRQPIDNASSGQRFGGIVPSAGMFDEWMSTMWVEPPKSDVELSFKDPGMSLCRPLGTRVTIVSLILDGFDELESTMWASISQVLFASIQSQLAGLQQSTDLRFIVP
ncbi:hypothetical protein MPER_11379 [Moniliophthora perniciosa FA553]|nr:hypothetical protein MPER_11379 [Moniliophthora perniciosa FA553]